MRIRFLKNNYYWDAYIFDLQKELKHIPSSTIKQHINKILKYYITIYLYLTGYTLDKAIMITQEKTNLKINKNDKTKIQKEISRISKTIGYKNLQLIPNRQKKYVEITKVLKEYFPAKLKIPISEDIALEFQSFLKKKTSKRKKLKHIDNLTIRILETEYKRRRRYFKNMDLKFASIRIANETNLHPEVIYKEIRKRIYRKFRYLLQSNKLNI